MNDSKNEMKVVITGTVDNASKFRTEPLLGKNFTVLPATMMVVGAYYPHVDKFSSPERLHFGEKALMQSVNTWNGRPVAINHPDGSETCNSPTTYDKQWVGYVFNTFYDKNSTSLKAELWIDENRGRSVTALAETGEQIDVSIGAFGDLKSSLGKESYDYTMTNIVGDHLAILPDNQGACSWKDGCGIRAVSYKLEENKVTATTGAVEPSLLTNNERIKSRGELVEDRAESSVISKMETAASTDRNVGIRAADSVSGNVDQSVKFDHKQWLDQAPTEFRDYLIKSMKTCERIEVNNKKIKMNHIKNIVTCTDVTFCEQALSEIEDLITLENIANLVDIAAMSKETRENPVVSSTVHNYQLKASAGNNTKEKLDYAPFKDIDYVAMQAERLARERRN